MKERIITFETAKLAKEKGLNWDVLDHYTQEDCTGDNFHIFQDDVSNLELEHFEYSAPTQSLLQKWLREKHNINVTVEPEWDDGKTNGFLFTVFEPKKIHDEYAGVFEKYEEALEAGLQEALKMIK